MVARGGIGWTNPDEAENAVPPTSGLDAFLAKNPSRRGGVACSICDLFKERPDLANEVVSARGRQTPVSFNSLCRYLKGDHGIEVNESTLAAHLRKGHGKGKL